MFRQAAGLLVLVLPLAAATTRGRGETIAMADDVAFAASVDGTQQRYMLVLPEGFAPDEPHDVLIALHGHGADRRQFIRDARDECRAVRDVAAARGMILVSPDYRATTSWMGPAAEADVVDIIKELRTRYRVARVFLCGASMGGAACLTFTALHPDLVDGVASMNGIADFVVYENFQDAIARSFGGSKEEVPEEYRRRSALSHATAFTMPMGVTTGGRDTSTPPHSVLRLVEEVRKTNRRVLLIHREREGHRTGYDDARAILEFVVEQATAPRSARGPVVAAP
jgi:pimeloyl-ACP methyl ester carboxylesterase